VNKSVIFVVAVVVGVSGLFFFLSHSKNAEPAPDFNLPVLEGAESKTLQLSSLKGKAVLVNLWATWCEPCKVEMPWLVELQKKYGDQGFVILGVAQDDATDQEVLAFAHKMKLNYPILRGNNHMNDLYPSQGLPLSVYVDRSGKVVQRVVGLVRESVMEDAIKKALEQGGGAGKSVASGK
jgi:thiol-disulfide isomerase/thioredoxin